MLLQIGLRDLEIIPSAFPEDLPKSLAPFEYVLETATKKAMTVYEKEIDNKEKGEPALIIAADTVVVGHFGEILEKPRSEREHIEMLKNLRDNGDHKVFTAVACMRPLESAKDPGYAMKTHVEDTTVKFDKSGVYRDNAGVCCGLGKANLCGHSHGRTDTRVRQNKGRRRQGRRLWHSGNRLHLGRPDRGHI